MLFEYEAQREDELTLVPGDELTVLQEDEGWWLGLTYDGRQVFWCFWLILLIHFGFLGVVSFKFCRTHLSKKKRKREEKKEERKKEKKIRKEKKEKKK